MICPIRTARYMTNASTIMECKHKTMFQFVNPQQDISKLNSYVSK